MNSHFAESNSMSDCFCSRCSVLLCMIFNRSCKHLTAHCYSVQSEFPTQSIGQFPLLHWEINYVWKPGVDINAKRFTRSCRALSHFKTGFWVPVAWREAKYWMIYHGLFHRWMRIRRATTSPVNTRLSSRFIAYWMTLFACSLAIKQETISLPCYHHTGA